MAIKNLVPYVSFSGEASKAIAHYQKALGATVENVLTWSDAPPGACGGATPAMDAIMHACLKIGDARLMLSDAPPGVPTAKDSNVQITVQLDDAAQLEKTFDSLVADGGKATLPVHDAFWGSKFGMLTDKFGVRWMLECPKHKG